MKKLNKKSGFIQLILLIVVVVLVLSYFGISIKSVANSTTGQENFSFIGDILGKIWAWMAWVWSTYLVNAWHYFWNEIFVKYALQPMIANLDKIKN
jgi:hypothetical protein